MKRVSTVALTFSLALCAAAVARAQAGVRPRTAQAAEQGPNGKDATPANSASEAQTLYDEAAQYAQHKFDEFRQN